MPDLCTSYLGCTLQDPLVVSASPLSEEIDNLRRMEDAGAAAIVRHMSHQAVADPSAFERANYLRVLRSAGLKWRTHQ